MATAIDRVRVHESRLKLGLFALFGVVFLALLGPGLADPLTFWTGIVLGDYLYPGHQVHHFVLATVVALLLLGVIAQAPRPSHRAPALHTSVIVLLALVVSNLLGGEPAVGLLLFVALLLGMVLTHPAGREQLPTVAELHRPHAIVAGVTAIVAIGMAAIEILAHLSAADEHVTFGHYVMMATAWLSIGALGLLGSLRGRGWRFPTYGAVSLLLVFGVASVVFPGPEQGSSLGVTFGVIAVVWAIAIVLVAERGHEMAAHLSRE